PQTLIDEIMIPSIIAVGSSYEKRECFLPQLIASAETMKKGMEFLDNILRKQSQTATNKGVILLATVEGDIHDIGKNIVALLLKTHGYKIIDLGKDCSAEKIIKAIKSEKPIVVGLSALMTTTMIKMKEVITLATNLGLKTNFLIGGAVVTSEYAKSIGAHYAKDGISAGKVVEKIIARRKVEA
ncbi:MAG: cobalamin-dependent protein, partial [Deltaproteobacteria bacterium]